MAAPFAAFAASFEGSSFAWRLPPKKPGVARTPWQHVSPRKECQVAKIGASSGPGMAQQSGIKSACCPAKYCKDLFQVVCGRGAAAMLPVCILFICDHQASLWKHPVQYIWIV